VKDKVTSKSGDTGKWFLVLLLLVAGIVANSYFGAVAVAIRLAVGIVLSAVILAVVAQTSKGQLAWGFIKGSRNELRKVIWPTKQETTQTTLLVAVMVVITALILWGLDAFFFWMVKSLSA
jgi:preprotein translocase subunit SecE